MELGLETEIDVYQKSLFIPRLSQEKCLDSLFCGYLLSNLVKILHHLRDFFFFFFFFVLFLPGSLSKVLGILLTGGKGDGKSCFL